MTTAKVNKSEYEVHAYFGGYYGICKVGYYGANPIFGGDSADEDAYNQEYIKAVYNSWNGELEDCGNSKYGENGLILKF
jgi:hypothetical protein